MTDAMTNVRLAFKAATAEGVDVAQTGGYWEFRPYAPVVLPDYVLTTEKFTVHLGADPVLVDFRPTDAQWCWVGIPRQIPGAKPRYFSVPETTETINFFVPPGAPGPKITDVDPATLAPSAEPEAAWWDFANGLKVDWDAAVTAVASSATSAADSETAAAESAEAAGVSETNAANSATGAATSQASAASSATAAGTSATNAATSESNAATSATSALASKNSAATSETNAAGSATAASDSAATATTQAGLADAARVAAETARDQAVAATILTGTGSPEGVVTANVGRKYIDTAKTNGAREWIKDSGTGNTGWIVTVGDTGARLLSPLPGFTGTVFLTRLPKIIEVSLSVSPDADTAGGWVQILEMPAGFTIEGGPEWQLRSGFTSGSVRTVGIIGGYLCLLGSAPAGLPIQGTHTVTTRVSWPTALPGTPG